MVPRIVLLGPPGAGKGTQAETLARDLGVPRISTGDILREAVARGTDVGRRARAVLDAGALVDDDVMIEIVRERLSRPDARCGFLLDGFPRTVTQAEALDRLMAGRLLTIVELMVDEDELVRRLTSRRICRDCGTTVNVGQAEASFERCPNCGGELTTRSDDREEIVRERFRVYLDQTAPLVDYYRRGPGVIRIEGLGTPDSVAAALRVRLERAGLAARTAGS